MAYGHCSGLIDLVQYPLISREVLNMVVMAYSYLRFSSTEQRKGNSFDRQIRGRDAYIGKKDLTLDSSLIIEDAGVSAFRGINAATGALRVFLDACEQKRVRPGSYLIVENL